MVRSEDITAEFAPEFFSLKDLAKDLRDVLFPFRGKPSTRTYKDRNIVYDKMIYAFYRPFSHLRNE